MYILSEHILLPKIAFFAVYYYFEILCSPLVYHLCEVSKLFHYYFIMSDSLLSQWALSPHLLNERKNR